MFSSATQRKRWSRGSLQAVAGMHQLFQRYGGNDQLNWIEAEIHVSVLVRESAASNGRPPNGAKAPSG